MSNKRRARVAQRVRQLDYLQLIQANHQYGVGSRPALQITIRVRSTHSRN